jgi:hypothetical protein
MKFIFLNIFIGVIVHEWGSLKDVLLKPDDMEKFQLHWQQHDPAETGLLVIDKVENFEATLAKPMGFGGDVYSTRQMIRRIGKGGAVNKCLTI